MTDSPASMNRSVARSRIWAAGILGLKEKSNSSMVVVCSKRAAFSRRSSPVASRRAASSSHRAWSSSMWPSSPALAWARRALEGLEHAEELQLTELVFEVMGRLHQRHLHRRRGPAGPCRWAGADGAMSVGRSSPSCSVPATRMPFTVL